MSVVLDFLLLASDHRSMSNPTPLSISICDALKKGIVSRTINPAQRVTRHYFHFYADINSYRHTWCYCRNVLMAVTS